MMAKIICVLMALLLLHCSGGLPTYFGDGNADDIEEETTEKSFYVEYLEKYGYLDPLDTKGGMRVNQTEITDALKIFQKRAGIPITGSFDVATNYTMLMARCGVKDIENNASQTRLKRYEVLAEKWFKSDLAYRLKDASITITRNDTESEIEKAFGMWSKHVELNFTKKDQGGVDIELKFATREHGDGDAFDGKGGTYAHATGPQKSEVHFDDDENWTIGSIKGTNFRRIAVHEIGHTLGLGHSKDNAAIMAPFFEVGSDPNFELHQDDIDGIQSLYGTTTGPSELDPNDFCKIGKVDAVTKTQDGTIYIFKGNYYYKRGIGKPRPIIQWPYITGPIDAALSLKNGSTYLFKGKDFWQFYNKTYINGPKRISAGFPGFPRRVDATFVTIRDIRTYLIKGDQYWLYNSNFEYADQDYLKTTWTGLPSKIDAAIRLGRRIFFFSGKKYYRLDNTGILETGDIRKDWFGCPDENEVSSEDGGLQEIKDGDNFFENSIFGGARITTIDMNLLFLIILCVLAIVRLF